MYTLPDEYVLGGFGAILLLLAFAIQVRRTSWNYVWPRLLQSVRGGAFVEEVDQDNKGNFAVYPIEGQRIMAKDRTHTIEPNSALRNPDGTIYQVHKDVERSITPHLVRGANQMNKLGFQSLPHALKFYKMKYFEEDWVEAQKQIIARPQDKTDILQAIEEKIGIELMSPVVDDRFTQNLSIINRWTNQELSAYGLKNAIDKARNEAERQNSQGGWTANKILGFVTTVLIVLAAITFLLIVLNSTGVIHLTGAAK